MCRSVPQMDAAFTFKITSSGPHFGTSTVSIDVPRPATFFMTARIMGMGGGSPSQVRTLDTGGRPFRKRILRCGGRKGGSEAGALDLAEDADAVRVELRPRVLLDLRQRHLVGQRLPVDPVVDHGVPGVGDRDEPRAQRNRGPLQARR